MTEAEQEVYELTRRLLEAIATADWETYELLCAPSLTAFEPEARGHLVEGLDFHRYYLALGRPATPVNTSMAAPHVRLLGDDAAVVSYVRLIQSLGPDQKPVTASFEETRVWHRQHGQWRHVHFHRSVAS
jgi:calcium/calmodulin-dependent protein kinase (CaM kinase) II